MTVKRLLFVFVALLLGQFADTGNAADAVGTQSRKSAKTATAESGFSIAPAPAWVIRPPQEARATVQQAPMHYEVIDQQTRLDRDSVTAYEQVTRVVNSSAGLDSAAQIQVVFDPSYQRLVMHRLDIWRGGVRLNRLDRKKITLLHRETRLEYQMYDGRMTASIVLDDVRIGDRIDYAYSLQGMNPVFEGKFVDVAWTSARKGPVGIFRYRLLAPEQRRIAHRAGVGIEVTEAVHGGMRETIFRRISVPQFQPDTQAPASSYIDDQLQLSEFTDWTDVVRWGERLFEVPVASALIRERAEAIRAAAGTPLERLRLALNFVQSEVRYFGMEMGSGSHRPALPDAVLGQRFGDCKDKTFLLIALLKAMDINATPVLVSTFLQGAVASLVEGPLGFDHVIARSEVDGIVYWLDATRSQQTGPLSQRQSVGLGKGLVLGGEAAGLKDLPGTASEPRIAVDEAFHVTGFTNDLKLEARTTYFGELAERVRAALAEQGADAIEKFARSEYVRFYPKLRVSVPMRVDEVPGQNAITLVQQFDLPEFWRFPEERQLVGEFALWNVAAPLRHQESQRKLPFRLPYPGVYKHSSTVDFPEEVFRSGDTGAFDESNPQFDYHVKYDVTPRSFSAKAELRLIADVVAPADWPTFTAKLNQLRPRFGAHVNVSAITLGQLERLRADVQNLEESLRKGSFVPRPVTGTQRNARVRMVYLNAQLESGRLAPVLRAQALASRGTQRDMLGEEEAASGDFAEAMRLAPESARVFAGAAVNAFLRGKDSNAVELVEKALKLSPSDNRPRMTRAFALYGSGNYAGAKAQLLELLKSGAQVEYVYPALWLYLSARRSGEDGIAAVQSYLPVSSRPSWPYPVLQYFIGKADFDQAFSAARQDPKDPSRLCELYYYVGEKYRAEGDLARAREYFQKSIDTGVIEFTEYAMAKRGIKELAGR
ncbi:MAG TPA: DUF3857 domain-containing protein [Burkholderiales bacterium]|nr:DUF3857 domain-containing protein [Burkholderiales bacterium]